MKFLQIGYTLIYIIIVFALTMPSFLKIDNKEINKNLPIKINEKIIIDNLYFKKCDKEICLNFRTNGKYSIEGKANGFFIEKNNIFYFNPRDIKFNKRKISNIEWINKLNKYTINNKLKNIFKEKLNIKIYKIKLPKYINEKYINKLFNKNIILSNNNLKLKIDLKWKYFLISTLILIILYLKEIGIGLIIFYQKFISHKKGYRCAKGVLYNKGTCSSCVKEKMEKEGFIAGIKEYFKTTKECKEAMKIIKEKKEKGEWKSIEIPNKKYITKENTEKGIIGGIIEESICGCGEASLEGACDIGSCDAGACDIGSCDAGACDIGAC